LHSKLQLPIVRAEWLTRDSFRTLHDSALRDPNLAATHADYDLLVSQGLPAHNNDEPLDSMKFK
jgi:hypothetical protein